MITKRIAEGLRKQVDRLMAFDKAVRDDREAMAFKAGYESALNQFESLSREYFESGLKSIVEASQNQLNVTLKRETLAVDFASMKTVVYRSRMIRFEPIRFYIDVRPSGPFFTIVENAYDDERD